MDKTKVINTSTPIRMLSKEQISSSYRWDKTRNTFPSNWWIEILFDFLKNRKTKSELQSEYKATGLEKSNVDKSDNNMHINVLFKRLYISDTQDYDIFQNMKDDEVKKVIIDYINDVISDVKGSGVSIKNNWLAQIDGWERYVSSIEPYSSAKLFNFDPIEIQNFVRRSVNNYRDVIYTFDNVFKDSAYDLNDESQNEEVGKIGESIVRDILIKKYGIDNVFHAAEHDKYSPYDFMILKNGEPYKYIEVKSTMHFKTFKWYISRREIEFYKRHKNNYEICFVRNVFCSKESNAMVNFIDEPDIITNDEIMGIKNGAFYVTPYKYRGLA